MRRNLKSQKGQGTLAFVFIAGSIIILIGLTLAFLVISFTNTSGGFQAANRALAAASAGIEDALLQLIRGRNFGPPPGNTYDLVVGNVTTTVIVDHNSPAAGQATITSSAAALGSRRRIRAVVSIESGTKEVSVLSWRQVAL